MEGCAGSECSWNSTQGEENNSSGGVATALVLGLAVGLGSLVIVLAVTCTIASVITVLHRRSKTKSRIMHIDSPSYQFSSIPSLHKPTPSNTSNSEDATATQESAHKDPCMLETCREWRREFHEHSNTELSKTGTLHKAVEIEPSERSTQDKRFTIICLTKQNSSGFTEDVILDTILMLEPHEVFDLSENQSISNESQSISNRPPLPTPPQDHDWFPSTSFPISPTPVTAIREQTTTQWWHRWRRQNKNSLEVPGELSGCYVNEGMGPLNQKTGDTKE